MVIKLSIPLSRTIRFIRNQYRQGCRAGFGRKKAIRRAVSAYRHGFK